MEGENRGRAGHKWRQGEKNGQEAATGDPRHEEMREDVAGGSC